MKKVYIALSADVIHHGHINLINNAKKYGSLIVGLLTDKAIASFKRMPLLNYQQSHQRALQYLFVQERF